MSWTPSIPEGDAPIYERLTQALAADIASGALAAGERLPPQRDLAFRLGLGVGTVTRAYAEAERRGLLAGHVGRGSFVAPPRNTAGGGAAMVDMARNLPPAGPAAARLAPAMARLARRRDLSARLGYPPSGGFEADRAAGALWLGHVAGWDGLDPARVICTAGAQQAVAVALAAVCRPGEAIVAEGASFSGLKGLAAELGYRLVPAGLDGEGLTPEALDRAAAESGARAAYVLPTHNPTGRVMGARRRAEIAAVARARGLTLIEDDLYGGYATDLGLPPLARLAPERVFHATSLSKTVSPGLRAGYLVAPEGREAHEAALGALHAFALGAPGFGFSLASQWIEDGAAQAILDENRAEMAARVALALAVLGPAMEQPAARASLHVWLPMSEIAAERAAARALRAGVEVTPPREMILDAAAISGLRLCLGPAPDRAALGRALEQVKAALGDAAEARRDIV
ncbi:MAG: PLP-dependent aminotransferase family protein [Caulobacteraceae bacterium]|nr:PLP-dependent aminotransferase family protein [Caulobacteraceae bacterium]